MGRQLKDVQESKANDSEFLRRTAKRLEDVIDKLGKCFWFPMATLPTFLTCGFVALFLWEYFSFSIYMAMGMSCVIGLLTNILVLLHSPSFSAFVLCTPELFARFARILIAQVALLHSPLPGIQTNLQTFLGAQACITSTVLEEGIKSSKQVVARALDVTKNLIDSINKASDDIQEGIKTPFNAVSTAIAEVKKFFDDIGSIQQNCQNAFGDVTNSCSGVVQETQNACGALDKIPFVGGHIRNGVCGIIDGIREGCYTLDKSGICNGFHEISKPSIGLNQLDGMVKQLRDEFDFRMELKSAFNNQFDNESLLAIKADFEKHITENFDTIMLLKQMFSCMVIFSLAYLVITKSLLVRKFRNGSSVKCARVSKFFLVSNPFTGQLLVLGLFAFLDFGIRYLYQLQRSVLAQNTIDLSAQFSASVSNQGGSVSKLISEAITKSFHLYDEMQNTLDLSVCYENDMQQASILSYVYVAVGLTVGILTYKLDIACRKNQKQILCFATTCYGKIRPGHQMKTNLSIEYSRVAEGV